MNQLKQIVASLSTRQRISILVTALLVFGGLWGFAKWRRETGFRPLYTGMAPEDAGAVVQKLKETGVEYRLSEVGRSVLVPAEKIAESRLTLASAGLPKSGRIGFELFDKNNFGATEFVEHINYRRALEGELERSVMCLAEVDQARVHISFPKESIYLDAQQAAKASVMVRLRPGTRLAPNNLLAVSQMVASAVEGLSPESVAVLDMQGNLLSRPKRVTDDGSPPSEQTIETRQRIERDLVAKINHTLEPLLGPEKFRAGVSVECDFSSGEQSEETFDPSKSVMAVSQKTEDTTTGSALPFGVPGTAANLPRPATQAGATASAGVSRRTENITYQTSRVMRKTRLVQGSVKRMSVAVLLDHNVRWEGNQRSLVAPSTETIKAIRDLVAGVAGLVPDRGDQLIVESLPFDSTLNAEPPPTTPAAPSGPARSSQPFEEILKNRPVLIAVAACACLALLLIGFAFTHSSRKQPSAQMNMPPALEPPEPSLPDMVAQRESVRAAAEPAEDQHDALPALAITQMETPEPIRAEIILARIRESIQTDAGVPAHLLRTWMREAER